LVVSIKGIKIRAFRGVPSLELLLERKSLLLKGENGTGKSSIVEAIEFFFRGRISHLEGTQGVSLRKHGPHVRYKQKDMRVELTFDPGDVSLQRTLKEEPSPPPHLTSVLDAGRKDTYILRRSQILGFIESDPAVRFAAIEDIMGVRTLDEIELSMMRARDQSQGELSLGEEALRKAYKNIEEIVGAQVPDLSGALPAMSRKAENLNLPPMTSLDDIPNYAKRVYAKLRRKSEKAPVATASRKVAGILEKPLLPEETIARLSHYSTRVNYLVSQEAAPEVSRLRFLELGEGLVADSPAETCPLCGQDVDKEELLREIADRKRLLAQLSDEASKVRRESVVLEGEIQGAIGRLDSALLLVEQAPGLVRFAERLKRERKFFHEMGGRIESSKELAAPLEIKELEDHQSRTSKLATAITKASDELLEKTELTEEESAMVDFFQTLGSFNDRVKEISNLQADVKTKRLKFGVADALFGTFSEAKRARVQAAYDVIQGTIQQYYSRLHPGEPSRTIRLQIYPGRRASTKIAVDSYNLIGEDPRALESEGHLDSLGICIFLAFVKAFSPDCPLIILDDVVTTIDASHRKKLAELLFEEFSDKQLVITTHDEIWYEQFVELERAYRVENNFRNVEITGWDLDSGPRIRKYLPRWERIEESIKAGDKWAAGTESRKYLEWILERGSLELEVAIALRIPPRYEVGDYLPPLRKRVESLFEEGNPKVKILSAFDELRKNLLMGNLLSHNNIFASNVSITEVGEFADSVRSLHMSFCCSTCGSFLTYVRELKIIRCPGPRCATPLEVKARE
jgi:DNA repair exonuclease SbcCD ATPase subunit